MLEKQHKILGKLPMNPVLEAFTVEMAMHTAAAICQLKAFLFQLVVIANMTASVSNGQSKCHNFERKVVKAHSFF